MKGKKKAAAKKPAKKAVAASLAAPAFEAGQSVRVLSGDHGNAHGSILSIAGSVATVQLGNNPEPVEVELENLVAGGANDRV